MLALLVVLGCAEDRPEIPLNGDSTFPALEAEAVFTAGFLAIAERYIDDVALAPIALEAVGGLAAIDPELALTAADGQVRMTFGEVRTEEVRRPDETDARGWARLAVRAILAAREASEPVRAASPEKLYEAVFDAALARLDVFSRYAGAEETRRLRAQRDGQGEIGIHFRKMSGGAEVTLVVLESSAARAGLRANDLIRRIDGVEIDPLDEADIARRLAGAVGSTVRLDLLRDQDGREESVALERALVVPPTVVAERREDLMFLRVSGFNQGTAALAADKLAQARKTAPRGVVLDLRGNPGGRLDQAVALADLFLTQGRIVATRGRHPQASQNHDATEDDAAPGLPLVVLIDGRSASAAEIVAAALQDRGRAVLVGTNSYGKGLVQTIVDLPNGAEITLTWSRYHAPSGYALHGLGVLPTICTSAQAGNRGGLAPLLAGDGAAARMLALWRTMGANATPQRLRPLREACPSEERTGAFDDEIAKRLILEPGLYAKALTLTGSTSIRP
ncbi:MAG: PDZ domain-containing protein [Rhodospirillales bacterium]|nr:PDZ domain-containing protein [Rhodospirillales bacterium]